MMQLRPSVAGARSRRATSRCQHDACSRCERSGRLPEHASIRVLV